MIFSPWFSRQFSLSYLFEHSFEILVTKRCGINIQKETVPVLLTVTKISSILITPQVIPVAITVAKMPAIIDLIYNLLPFNSVLVLE